MKYFSCQLDIGASSPDPLVAIWRHQHVCVTESLDWMSDELPSRSGMANAIIKQMKQGHWHVLCGAFAKIGFAGYPHDTAMQWRTHQDPDTLTTSMRYTHTRFMADNSYDRLEELFYFENGHDQIIHDGLANYRELILAGTKPEVARRYLPGAYRQGWSTAGTLKSWLHVLEQRTCLDAQSEAAHAARKAVVALLDWCPELMPWWIENRAGKNKSAP